jgi:hypothetical protein
MSVDEILAYLVRRTEETGIGHAITLCIGGNVVSGFMINSKKYYEIMLNYFEKSEYSGEDKHHDEKWNDYKKDYKDFMINLKTNDDSSNQQIDKVKYIQLKDASIIISNMAYTFPVWRGKLSSVDGFCLREITDTLETPMNENP